MQYLPKLLESLGWVCWLEPPAKPAAAGAAAEPEPEDLDSQIETAQRTVTLREVQVQIA